MNSICASCKVSPSLTCISIPIHADYELGDPDDDDGNNWSEWSNWGPCTKTCGGGMRIRQRECLEDLEFMVDCSGEVKQLEDCSTNPCESRYNAF